MNTGMMWFDNDPKTNLRLKVERAVDYYQKKYGQKPNLCLIHPNMMEKEKPKFETLIIRPYHPVLPGHMWIGVEENIEE